MAYQKVKEAQLTYALETKGKFNVARYVRNNPLTSFFILWLAFAIAFVILIVSKYFLYKNRIMALLKDENIPLNNITISTTPTNSFWIRDYGPFFIELVLFAMVLCYENHGIWEPDDICTIQTIGCYSVVHANFGLCRQYKVFIQGPCRQGTQACRLQG